VVAGAIVGLSDNGPTLESLGAVRTVEPEQFPGGSDDVQLAQALDALADTGGVIRLRPGKTYKWQHAIPSVDWAGRGQVILQAWGAVVHYAGTGSAFTSIQSKTPAGQQTLTVFGGTWQAPDADTFFRIQDSGNHLFYRCRGEVPKGTMFALSNVRFWSERNHFVEIEDHNCREVVRFSIDGSVHSSFARTMVKDLRIQGGSAGYPKINVVTSGTAGAVLPAPYDSTFDGIVGNLPDGVIVQRLAGGLSGTKILRIQVEAPKGSQKAAIWDVGELMGHLPVLPEGPPVLRNLLMFTLESSTTHPFGPLPALGGIAAGGAFSSAPFTKTLDAPGSVAVNADQCNVVFVKLNAACTATTIQTGLGKADTQSLTLAFQQGAAGGFGYAWPSNCRFAKGKPPTDTAPMTQTSVTFTFQAGLWLETARAEAVPYV
jgi:hypothetical protein